jgi:hypothetical protein
MKGDFSSFVQNLTDFALTSDSTISFRSVNPRFTPLFRHWAAEIVVQVPSCE